MWNWSEQCEKAFVELKGKFPTTPILCYYHPERKKQIETDASDLCKAGILYQYEPESHLHPPAYYNKHFLPAELNYDVHDKEVVIIFNCCQEWRHFLMPVLEEIVVFTDHKDFAYFNATKLLNQRQAHWAEIWSQFTFKIVHRPGEKNGNAGPISLGAF